MGAPNALTLGEGLNFEGLKKELAYKLCSLVIEAVEIRLGLQDLSDEDIIFVRAVFCARMNKIISTLTDDQIGRINAVSNPVHLSGWSRKVVEKVLAEVLERMENAKRR